VFAARRPSWSNRPAEFPGATAFEQTLPYAKISIPWVKQYDFRFVEGEPKINATHRVEPASAYSKLLAAR
jgi:hypothetical protein